MESIRIAGNLFSGMRDAAAAWADTALPDARAIGASEDVYEAAKGVEAFWWADRNGVAPEGVEDVGRWRTMCRRALVQKIEAARA